MKTTYRRFALTIALLAAGLSISRAEEVTIYRPQNVSTPPKAASAMPAAAPAPAKLSPAVSAVSSNAVQGAAYTVQKGDTLWKISQSHHVTLAALQEANGLKSNAIRVGAVLRIPGAAPGVAKEEVRRAERVDAPAVSASAPVPATAQVIPMPAPAKDGNPALTIQQQAALQQKLVAETKRLARLGVRYDGDWTPPGEGDSWDMDCSNTTRYLYRATAGVDMERTASDQYYDLQQKGLAWDAPLAADGRPDSAALDAKLQIGDLLFWQDTYKPRRDPPITHVMIYLGKNAKGDWLMAGSQMGGGFFNVSGSGPDVYRFNPRASVGGYYKNLGFTHVAGKFVAFGRPMFMRDALPPLPSQQTAVAANP